MAAINRRTGSRRREELPGSLSIAARAQGHEQLGPSHHHPSDLNLSLDEESRSDLVDLAPRRPIDPTAVLTTARTFGGQFLWRWDEEGWEEGGGGGRVLFGVRDGGAKA